MTFVGALGRVLCQRCDVTLAVSRVDDAAKVVKGAGEELPLIQIDSDASLAK